MENTIVTLNSLTKTHLNYSDAFVKIGDILGEYGTGAPNQSIKMGSWRSSHPLPPPLPPDFMGEVPEDKVQKDENQEDKP